MKIKFKNFLKKTLFEDVIYEWLNNKKISIKESSYNKYLSQIETNILPYFKGLDIKRIDKAYIYNYLEEEKITNLSNSTKNHILIIINSFFNFCVSKKYINNYEKLNIKFKENNNDIKYFSKKEQDILIQYINENMNLRNLLILFTLFTGLRIGEVCVLKGTDIDFVNNTVSINKSVQRIKDRSNSNNKTKLVIDKPKTKSSIRIVPVPEFIVNILNNYITDKNNFIFTDTNEPKDPRSVQKYFTNLLKKLEIRNLNFHCLRHSYATRLMEEKVDIKVISELLGHADWKTTESIYVHVSFDYKKDSVDKLSNLWNSKKFVEVN